MYLEYIAEYTLISFRNTLMWDSVVLVYLIVIASGGNPKIRKSENPPVNLKRHPAEEPGETAEKYLAQTPTFNSIEYQKLLLTSIMVKLTSMSIDTNF